MVDFFNGLDLNNQKYQTNGTASDKGYKEKFLFNMKDFVLFGTEYPSMFFMSTRFLRDKIYGSRVLKFQLYYIRDTTHPSNKCLVELCCEIHYM